MRRTYGPTRLGRVVNALELASWLSVPPAAAALDVYLTWGDARALAVAVALVVFWTVVGLAGGLTPTVNCWTLAHAERVARWASGRVPGVVRAGRFGHHVLDLGDGTESSWTPRRGRWPGWERERRPVWDVAWRREAHARVTVSAGECQVQLPVPDLREGEVVESVAFKRVDGGVSAVRNVYSGPGGWLLGGPQPRPDLDAPLPLVTPPPRSLSRETSTWVTFFSEAAGEVVVTYRLAERGS